MDIISGFPLPPQVKSCRVLVTCPSPWPGSGRGRRAFAVEECRIAGGPSSLGAARNRAELDAGAPVP